MFQALQLGPLILWTRLAFVLLGVYLSTEFFLRLANSANLSLQHFREHGWWYVAVFLIGGRWFAMVAAYKVYLNDPSRILILWDGGFSLLGAAIGIGCVLFYVTREHRTTFLQWLDALVPATSFGLVFEWLGAFFAGDSYGRPTDLFWGVTYDAIDVRYAVPIHPVQLYYALFFFLLTFLLLVVRKREKRVGTETLVGIICASVGTFLLESFRGDFGIPVFATQIDFALLLALFLSLGSFAALGNKLSKKVVLVCEALLFVAAALYILLRSFLDLDTYELRFSQVLAVLALLVTVVYVIDHRRRYPYL